MGSVLVVKILNNHQADRIRLIGIDGPEKGLISSNEPRTPPQSWFMGKKSLSRHAARTSTGAPLPICCDLMAPTSNTRWSRRLVRWYRKYARGDTVLEGLEIVAREVRNGLWAAPQPVPA